MMVLSHRAVWLDLSQKDLGKLKFVFARYVVQSAKHTMKCL